MRTMHLNALVGSKFNYASLGSTITWKISEHASKSSVSWWEVKKNKKKTQLEFVNEFIIQQNRIQLSVSWYALLRPVKSL